MALGFSLPISSAAISIFMILSIILTLLDRSSYQKIYNLLKLRVFQSYLLFFILHIVGFSWLDVGAVDWHKSWMIWMIPILAVSVSADIAKKGIFAFILGMFLAELYVYFNIFSIWTEYLRGEYGDHIMPISHVAYNPILAVAIGLLMIRIINNWHNKNEVIIGIFFLTTMIINMFMTGGRAGQLGFIFIWLAVTYYYLRGKKNIFFGMFFTMIFVLITAYNFSSLFQSRVDRGIQEFASYINYLQNDEVASYDVHAIGGTGLRLHFYETSLKLLKESPIIGHGTGSTKNIFYKFVEENSAPWYIKTSNPHSNHSLILVQFGILGFLVYLNIFYQAIKAAKFMPKEYEYRAMAFFLPMFFFFINFFDSYLWGHHTQALFAYLSAILFRPDLYSKI